MWYSMSDRAKAVAMEKVQKSFEGLAALHECSWHLDAGGMLCIAGSDGAGKSTLLRLAAGLLQPDEGIITVNGQDVKKSRQQVGYMAQAFSWYTGLSIEENLKFACNLYGMEEKYAAEYRDEILQFVGLYRFKDRLAGRLSGGMKQKMALAAAIIHSPAVLLLDEPSTGVDPVSRQELWELISSLNEKGTAVAVATPYFDETEYCREVMLLDKGRILVHDSLHNLKMRAENMEDLYFELTADDDI